jgi:hypothetical protein
MPTYIYETIPVSPGTPVRRFELKQSMSAPTLTHDPETGEPVQRVITGGQGPLLSSEGLGQPAVSGGCSGGCACHP